MVVEEKQIPDLITLIDDKPIKFSATYQQRSEMDDPLDQHPYYYIFNFVPGGSYSRFIINATSDVYDFYFVNKKAEMHLNALKFGILQIHKGIVNEIRYFDTEKYKEMKDAPKLDGLILRHEILNFIYLVNNILPAERIDTENIELNINADSDKIKQWLDNLSEVEFLYKKRIDRAPNRFGEGHVGMYTYRINPKNFNDIQNELSKLQNKQMLTEKSPDKFITNYFGENLNLSYQKDSYKDNFYNEINKFGQEQKSLFINLLQKLIGFGAKYEGKVTKGNKPFAVHLYDPEFPNNVIAWLYPTKEYINIRLYKGANISDIEGFITNKDIKGTPHPINMRINNETNIDKAIAAIDDSAEKMNNQKNKAIHRFAFDNISPKDSIDVTMGRAAPETLPSGGMIVPPSSAQIGPFGVHNDERSQNDLLGYEDYADAISSFITNENTETPLTIAICAPWGRGKTQLLDFIKKKVEAKSKDKFECINFNAWKYSKTDYIWIELYTGIIDSLHRLLSKWQKVHFNVFLLWYIIKDYPYLNTLLFIFFLFSFFLIVNAFWGELVTGIILFILSLLSIFKISYKDLFISLAKLLFEKSFIDNARSTLGLQYELFIRFDLIANWIDRNLKKKIVLLIDDIDRCVPTKIMQTLEAIRHLLPYNNFVFVLALDAKVVNHAVGEHYQFMCKPNEKKDMGRLYLEKIIQIPFHLPKLDSNQLNKLQKELLKDYTKSSEQLKAPSSTDVIAPVMPKNKDQKEKTKDINGSKEGLEQSEFDPTAQADTYAYNFKLEQSETDVIEEITKIDGIDFSPRQFKRFINIYMIARHLLILENNKKESRKPYYVPEICFIKWLALSVIYPFESSALMRWFERNDFKDPREIVFKDGVFDWLDDDKKSPTYPFHDLSRPILDEFCRIYSLMKIDSGNIKNTRHILDCFNLILE